LLPSPGPKKEFAERLASSLKRVFSVVGAEYFRVRASAGWLVPCVRQRSEAVDVDRGQLVGRRLKDLAVVMDPDEISPVGGRARAGKPREFDDAIGPRLDKLPPATPADPTGRLVPREHVTDATDAAVWAADRGQSLQCEGQPGATGRRYVAPAPVRSKVRAVCEKISELTSSRTTWRDPSQVVVSITRVFTGWANSNRIGYVTGAWNVVPEHTCRRFRRWMGRKHRADMLELHRHRGLCDLANEEERRRRTDIAGSASVRSKSSLEEHIR
jgi:hypothetical protein